ncbi:MAG: response regulator transcription factor [Gallicola sp.]|nr:response regulator transcription factor [Gallicola sp.]
MEGNKPTKILFADDDKEIRHIVRTLLENDGFEVVEAVNGKDAVEKADDSFDLIILDVMMPYKDGISVCVEIRDQLTVPILFLSAKSQDSDKTLGLAAGGDAYLSKPFSYAELIAQVKAMIRRYHVYRGKGSIEEQESIKIRDLTINPIANEVWKSGEEILLTDLEYRILLLFAKNTGRLFSIQYIYEYVWDEPYFYSSNNNVMVHIRNLRRKIEEDPKNPKILVNVWGKGYRIEQS